MPRQTGRQADQGRGERRSPGLPLTGAWSRRAEARGSCLALAEPQSHGQKVSILTLNLIPRHLGDALGYLKGEEAPRCSGQLASGRNSTGRGIDSGAIFLLPG